MSEPQFAKLTFADAGLYVCAVSMSGLMRKKSFELIVEGECLCVIVISSTCEKIGTLRMSHSHMLVVAIFFLKKL